MGAALFAAVFVRLSPTLATKLFIVLLLVMALGGVAEHELSARVWTTSDEGEAARVLASRLLGSDEVLLSTGVRKWKVIEDTNALRFEVATRVVDGGGDWAWRASDPGIEIDRRAEAEGAYAHLTLPDAGDPFAYRELYAPGLIAGQEFLVTVELRSSEQIPALGCRGVRLQVWGEGGGASCAAFEVGENWKKYEHIWVAPKEAAAPYLQVILNDFDGLSLDVRNASLFRRIGDDWQPLGELIGSGSFLRLKWGEGQDESFRVALASGSEAESLELVVASAGLVLGAVLEARVEIPQGTRLEIGPVRISDSLVPVSNSSRRSLWLRHPNFLGHTAATIGIGTIALAYAPWVSVVASAAALFVVALTGSRLALLALACAIGSLAAIRWHRNGLVAASIVLGALISIVLLAPILNKRLVSVDSTGSVSRLDIWAAAIGDFRAHVLTGTTEALRVPRHNEGGTRDANSETIAHAHNFLLELARRHGIWGLFAAIWLAGGLLVISWRSARWRGFAAVSSILLLQLGDSTLFYSGVLFPLIILMNALGDSEAPIRR